MAYEFTFGGTKGVLADTGNAIFEKLHAAEQIAQRFGALLSSSGPTLHRTQFYTRIRVKSLESINEKIFRKRLIENKSAYSFSDLTDVVGARVVTLYDVELPDALQLILVNIRRGMMGSEPVFSGSTVWDAFDHAKIYHKHGEKGYSEYYKKVADGIFAAMEKDLGLEAAQSLYRDKVAYQKASPDMYSSAHMIFIANSYVGPFVNKVPIEFQIRTAAEDIWAEINHKLQYKIKNPFVWSAGLEKDYEELRADSFELKTRVDHLYDIIVRFQNHSESVNQKIEKFRRPVTKFYHSLILSLIVAIGNEYLEDPDGNIETYNNIVGRLRPEASHRDFYSLCERAEALCGALKLQFQTDLDTITKKRIADGRTELSIDEKMIRERCRLLDFELLRLKIVQAVRRLGSNKGNRHDLRPTLEAQYRALCDFKTDRTAMVRPFAAVSFWKFYVQRHLDTSTALRHLGNARDELRTDLALPIWSVYRALIPRTLCKAVLADLKVIANENSGKTVPSGVMRVYDKYSLFVSAMIYGTEAYQAQTIEEVRRGDLSIRDNTIDVIGDIERLMLIYCGFYEISNTSVLSEAPQCEVVFRAALDKCLGLINTGGLQPETKRRMRALLERVHDVNNQLIQKGKR